MDSHRGGTGQLLHDLEEKMEVARVQLQILETMNSLRGSSYNLTRKEGSLLRFPILDLAQPPWRPRLEEEMAAEVFNGLSK